MIIFNLPKMIIDEHLYNNFRIRIMNMIDIFEHGLRKAKEIEGMLEAMKKYPEIDNIIDLDKVVYIRQT